MNSGLVSFVNDRADTIWNPTYWIPWLYSLLVGELDLAVTVYYPPLWVPRNDFNDYNVEGKIEDKPLMNECGDIASRSCLLSFLSTLRAGKVGSPGIYTSVGVYYRHEPKVIPGVREHVFMQLEIEVIDESARKALKLTLDLLRAVLGKLYTVAIKHKYTVKIQGRVPKSILARPEIQYAGVDRQWKLYKTKRDIGFEVYLPGRPDAIAGGGDFSELAWKFGLDRKLNAVGFGLGLLRIK